MKRYDYCGWGRLALRGPDRVRFLHGMVTCNVDKLVAGAGSRAAMLSVKGRLLATLVVYARPDELLLSLEPGLSDKVRTILDKHLVMDDVEIVDRAELEELGLYGEDAAAFLRERLGQDVSALPPYHQLDAGGVLVAADPSLGIAGFRVLGEAGKLSALHGGELLEDDEREALRVEHGTARYGVDLDEERLVVEANLEDALSFEKGCYLGQEVVVRATSRGRVNRKFMGLVLDGDSAADRGKLTSEVHGDAGVLTSSAVSRDLGPIALGYVHRAVTEADAAVRLESGRLAVPVALPFGADAVKAARGRLKP